MLIKTVEQRRNFISSIHHAEDSKSKVQGLHYELQPRLIRCTAGQANVSTSKLAFPVHPFEFKVQVQALENRPCFRPERGGGRTLASG